MNKVFKKILALALPVAITVAPLPLRAENRKTLFVEPSRPAVDDRYICALDADENSVIVDGFEPSSIPRRGLHAPCLQTQFDSGAPINDAYTAKGLFYYDRNGSRFRSVEITGRAPTGYQLYTGQQEVYEYDAHRKLRRTVTKNSAGVENIATQIRHFYDAEGNDLSAIDSSSTQVFFGSVRMETSVSGPAIPKSLVGYDADAELGSDPNVIFFIRDHLGTVVALADSAGIKEVKGNVPLGSSWYLKTADGQGDFTDYDFQGKRKEGANIDFHARHYNTKDGIFLTNDTVVPEGGKSVANFSGPTSFNNNSINYADPDGHIPLILVAMAVSAVANTVAHKDQIKNFGQGLSFFALGAAQGASAFVPGAGPLMNATMAVGFSAANQSVTGGKISLKSLGHSALSSFAGSGIGSSAGGITNNVARHVTRSVMGHLAGSAIAAGMGYKVTGGDLLRSAANGVAWGLAGAAQDKMALSMAEQTTEDPGKVPLSADQAHAEDRKYQAATGEDGTPFMNDRILFQDRMAARVNAHRAYNSILGDTTSMGRSLAADRPQAQGYRMVPAPTMSSSGMKIQSQSYCERLNLDPRHCLR